MKTPIAARFSAFTLLAALLYALLVMAPGLRGIPVGFSTAWQHPAVRRILRLYLPIALGLIVTQIQIIVDGRWASATGSQSVSWMRYATTLIQFPLGLVPVGAARARRRSQPPARYLAPPSPSIVAPTSAPPPTS